MAFKYSTHLSVLPTNTTLVAQHWTSLCSPPSSSFPPASPTQELNKFKFVLLLSLLSWAVALASGDA